MENAILDGTPPRISLTESRENIKTIEALYQSSRASLPIMIKN